MKLGTHTTSNLQRNIVYTQNQTQFSNQAQRFLNWKKWVKTKITRFENFKNQAQTCTQITEQKYLWCQNSNQRFNKKEEWANTSMCLFPIFSMQILKLVKLGLIPSIFFLHEISNVGWVLEIHWFSSKFSLCFSIKPTVLMRTSSSKTDRVPQTLPDTHEGSFGS